MPLEEFLLEFDNPTKSYFPGQNVTGRVVVTTPKEKNTQGLKIKFEGQATVHWSEEVTERAPGNQESRKVNKYYDDMDNFFDFKTYALGDGRSEIKIPPGRNTYPFNFALPAMNLPSSYVGQYGQVSYEVEATIKRSWKFDQVVKEKFTVNAIVDLNKETGATEPDQRATSKNFCCLCCASGPVGFEVKLPRKGFVPGEYISPHIDINNQSNRGVNGVSIALIQTATFFAQGSKNTSVKTVSEVKRPGVDPGDKDVWEGKILQVPSVPPTKLGGCRIIDVAYSLKFELHVSGIAFNLKESIPIIIGTIPLTSTFTELTSESAVKRSGSGDDYSPSAPPLYPDLPSPNYQDSFNFGPTPKESQDIVENVAGMVIDKVAPKEKDFVPKYVTYGWIMPDSVEKGLIDNLQA